MPAPGQMAPHRDNAHFAKMLEALNDKSEPNLAHEVAELRKDCRAAAGIGPGAVADRDRAARRSMNSKNWHMANLRRVRATRRFMARPSMTG